MLSAILVVCNLALSAQTVDTERSPYADTDNTPEISAYELFVAPTGRLPLDNLRTGYMPVSYSYRGLGTASQSMTLLGVPLAANIASRGYSTALTVVRSMEADTLAESFRGRSSAGQLSVVPFTDGISGRRVQVGAYGAVGSFNGGFYGSLSGVGRGVRYNVRFGGHFGSSIWGDAASGNGGKLSAAVQKDFGRVRLTAVVVCSPSVRGLRQATVDEAFGLAHNKLYNPSWGYCGGRRRNAVVRTDVMPIAVVNLASFVRDWRLSLSVGFQGGVRNTSALAWFTSQSPLPDNYRSLPSGVTGVAAEQLRAAWLSGDRTVTNVAWDRMAEINRARGGESAYLVVGNAEHHATESFVFDALNKSSRGVVRCGLTFDNSRVARFRRIEDLLGGTYVYNTDYYLSEGGGGAVVENDVAHSGDRLGEGDKIGYNYTAHRTRASMYGSFRRNSGRMSYGLGAEAGLQTLWRRGFWQKSTDIDSYGVSCRHTFADYDLSADFRYDFRVGNIVRTTLWCGSATPDFDNLFLAPEHSSSVVANAASGVRTGFDADYLLTLNDITLQASAYCAATFGAQRIYRYYDDLASQYSDMTATAINTLSTGVEAGVRYSPAASFAVALTAAYGCSLYVSNPDMVIYADNGGTVIADGSKSYLKGMHTGLSPELTVIADASYRTPLGFRLSVLLSVFAERYVEPNPLYRMSRVEHVAVSSETRAEFMNQRRLPSAVTLGCGISRFFELRHGAVSVSVTANNVLGNHNISYAYEQMRIRNLASEPAPAAIRKLYAYPVEAFLTISYIIR